MKKVKNLPNNDDKYSRNFCLKKRKCYRFKITDKSGGFNGKEEHYWKVSIDGKSAVFPFFILLFCEIIEKTTKLLY